MLNGKKYTTSSGGQQRVEKFTQIYHGEREKIYSYAQLFNAWVGRITGLRRGNNTLLLAGFATLLLMLVGLSLMLYRYSAFKTSATVPLMHQVEHARHIRERIIEEQQSKASAYPEGLDTLGPIISPNKMNSHEQ